MKATKTCILFVLLLAALAAVTSCCKHAKDPDPYFSYVGTITDARLEDGAWEIRFDNGIVARVMEYKLDDDYVRIGDRYRVCKDYEHSHIEMEPYNPMNAEQPE